MKKGYAIMLDAIVALSLVLLVFTAFYGNYMFRITQTSETSYKNLHYISEDALDTLNQYGVLDIVGEEWASGPTGNASGDAIRDYLESILPSNVGYRVEIVENFNNYMIVENITRVNEDDAIAKTHSSRLLVGYGVGLPTRGYVARAYLTNIREKETSKYVFYGGFIGQGNITSYVRDIPSDATIRQACLELNTPGDFDFYINDNFAKSFIPSASGMAASIKGSDGCISSSSLSYFTPGVDNKVEIVFTEENLSTQYVGGGYLRVTFNTSEMDTSPYSKTDRYWFHGIDGYVNYYSSIFIPENLNSMGIHLEFLSNYSTFLTIGSTLLLNTSGNFSNQSIDLDDTNLSNTLNYASLRGQTVPIRFSTGNFSGNQIANLTGDVNDSILYPTSYIEYNYTASDDLGYGEISLTRWTDAFNDIVGCNGVIWIPVQARVSDAKVTSYSAQYWTDYSIFNAATIYRLWDWGSDYSLMGDPYIVKIPSDLFNSGENNTVFLESGNSQAERTSCSADNRGIYTIRVQSLIGYGDVLVENLGCNWTVEFEDGSNITQPITVEGYIANTTCYYTPDMVSYPVNDAISDAMYRLLNHLDLDNNSRVDFIFDSDMLEFEYGSAGGVKSLWGPIELKLIVWI